MVKALDLVNQRFGRLLVIRRDGSNRHGQSAFICRCDCGTEKRISRVSLRTGHANSCGCLHREGLSRIAIAAKGYPPGEAHARVRYRGYIKLAEKRQLDYALTFGETQELFHGICYYCGAAPDRILRGQFNGKNPLNGIDRVDNSRGYVTDNCVSCCRDCNVSKRDMTLSDFLGKVSELHGRLPHFLGTVAPSTVVEDKAEFHIAAMYAALPKYHRQLPRNAAIRMLYSRYFDGARKRGLPFDLALQDAVKLFQEDCHYCGIIAQHRLPESHVRDVFVYNGIDRIDSRGGYSTQNCVSCCTTCNRLKMERGVAQFAAWVERIHRHRLTQTAVPSCN